MNPQYEPVVVTNLVVALLIFLGYEVSEENTELLVQVMALAIPVAGALVARVFTRSKASLAEEPGRGEPTA